MAARIDITKQNGKQDIVEDTGSDSTENKEEVIVEELDHDVKQAPAMVLVFVPHAFKIRVDSQDQLDIKAGPQKMFATTANHWYAKAHGVKVQE